MVSVMYIFIVDIKLVILYTHSGKNYRTQQ